MSKISDDFKIKVRDWVAYDNKILSANNAIKRVKEKQSEIGNGIITFMDNNNLQKKEIKINNYRLQYKTVKKTTPLTKKFIKQSLKEYLGNEEESTEIVNILYSQKKRMEMCLTQYFNDENKAHDTIEYIFNQRKSTETPKLFRKIQREPVTINNGPISEDAQNAIKTPDNTDSDTN